MSHDTAQDFTRTALPSAVLLSFFRPSLLSSSPQTFHSIPCLYVHLDAMDVAGDNHIDIDHDMWKQRLNPDGSAIGEAFTEVVSFDRLKHDQTRSHGKKARAL